jgi:hypothetical protein
LADVIEVARPATPGEARPMPVGTVERGGK